MLAPGIQLFHLARKEKLSDASFFMAASRGRPLLFSIYPLFSSTVVTRSPTSALSGRFGVSSKIAPAPFFGEPVLA